MGNIGISKAMSLCIKNFTKVYPIYVNRKWKVEAEYKGRTKVFEGSYTKDNINKAVADRYINIARQWIK